MNQPQRENMVNLDNTREQQRLNLESYRRPRMTEECQELGVNVGHQCVGCLMLQNAIKIIKTQNIGYK